MDFFPTEGPSSMEVVGRFPRIVPNPGISIGSLVFGRDSVNLGSMPYVRSSGPVISNDVADEFKGAVLSCCIASSVYSTLVIGREDDPIWFIAIELFSL